MDASTEHIAPGIRHTPWWRALVIAAGASLAVGVVLLAFAWPAVMADPKDLPIGLVATDDEATTVEEAIAQHAGDAIALSRYPDRDAAAAAIAQRATYGAIVLGTEPTDGPELLIASAASPQVAQLLQGIGTGLQQQINEEVRAQVEAGVQQRFEQLGNTIAQLQQALATGAPPGPPPGDGPVPETPEAFTIPTVTVTVTDLVPLSDRDPRGTGLTAAMFPLTLGGMLGAIVVSFLIHGAWRRLAAVVVYATAAGLALTGILQGWFGALQGSYGLNALAIAAAIAAISAPIVGLRGLLGTAGVGIVAAIMLFIANPISAATTPPEFLPTPWGDVGQWFPPGAAATLIRDLSYFPDAPTGSVWLVLTAWAAGGLVLIALGTLRQPRAVDD